MVNKLYGSRGTAIATLAGGDAHQADPDSQAPFVVKAVFQSLSALSKNYILRLLFTGSSADASTGMTEDEMRVWAISSQGGGSGKIGVQHATAVEELRALHVLQPAIAPDEGEGASRTTLVLNPFFRCSLQQALLQPREPWADALRGTKEDGQVHVPSKCELEALSAAKWDALLRFIVGIGADAASSTGPASAAGRIHSTTSLVVKPGGTIERFVRRMGLMGEGGAPAAVGQSAALKKAKTASGSLRITSLGYAYMLSSYQEQVWMFVYELISSASTNAASSSGTGQEQLLSLLFMLSYCQFGRGYPLNELTPDQQNLVLEFSQLGLAYVSGPAAASTSHAESILDRGTLYNPSTVQQHSAAQWLFYPSSIAINMLFRSHEPSSQGLSSTTRVGQEFTGATASLPGAKGEEEESSTGNIHRGISGITSTGNAHKEAQDSLSSGLEIIVETNMQVIAYLRSPLHLALLGLFVDLSVHLPNVAIGTITRERAKAAFGMGVRVDQIVDFLCVHAHPMTRAHQPIIPTNVVDQLVLWENERKRVSDQAGILMKFDEIAGFGADEFSKLEVYAKRIGMYLCSAPESMSLVVPYEGYEALRAFVEDSLLM